MTTTKELMKIPPEKLGEFHGKQLIKRLTRAELERIAKRAPLNIYERTKIKVIKDFLRETNKRNVRKTVKRSKRKKGKKTGKTIKPAQRQTGKSKNLARDKKLKALSPGKRISRSGKVYYEYRQNRSDLKGGV